jgi:high-affinity Fe2+/Pb2+ permease
MIRRLVVSLVLAVVLVVLQLVVGTGPQIALLTGLIAFVIAFLVLLVSDRWFTRTGKR